MEMVLEQLEGPHYKLVPCPGATRLLVFFAGTNKTDGKFDFWRVGNAQSEHRLFLNNGRNEWYQNGIPGFADSVDGIGRKIECIAASLGAVEIILHGVSMGGYAAALFAKLIGCKAMAFGFDSVLRIPHARSAQISKSVDLVFPDLSKISSQKSTTILHIAGEADAMDLKAAHHLLGSEGVSTLTLRGVGHGGAPFIELKYGLSNYIATFSLNGEMPDVAEKGRSAHSGAIVRRLIDLHVSAKAKDWRQVESKARLVLDLDPAHETANYWVGTALLESKLAGEAIPFLASAVSSAPHFANAQYRLARAYMVRKDVERAKFHLSEHAKLSPDAALTQAFISDLTRAEGDIKAADEILLRAYRIDSANKSVLERMKKYSLEPTLSS
ncbi:tetratricopeptide repeat protein [Pseudomonas putida]|uniref:Alpha/beta hydrolase n=2 Tax=Pseudomonas hunanensis TaxID=1247546 RepID=A0ABD6MUX1_9PSED|nr:alpha/beta hydrolase [Pseudomonas hunanensis]